MPMLRRDDVHKFPGKLKAIKHLIDHTQLSVSLCAAHVAKVMENDPRLNDKARTLGLKQAKDIVESIMALGVKEYVADLEAAQRRVQQGLDYQPANPLPPSSTAVQNAIDLATNKLIYRIATLEAELDGVCDRLRVIEDRHTTEENNPLPENTWKGEGVA